MDSLPIQQLVFLSIEIAVPVNARGPIFVIINSRVVAADRLVAKSGHLPVNSGLPAFTSDPPGATSDPPDIASKRKPRNKISTQQLSPARPPARQPASQPTSPLLRYKPLALSPAPNQANYSSSLSTVHVQRKLRATLTRYEIHLRV